MLFQAYLAGAALTTAAKEAAIHAFHSGIRHILQTTHYIGDDYYPAIIDADTFTAAQKEITSRAKNWGASGNLKSVTGSIPHHLLPCRKNANLY